MIIFRLPFEDKIYTTDDDSTESFISFFSFTQDQEIKFLGNIKEISKDEVQNINFQLPIAPISLLNESHEQYINKIENTIDLIKKNELKKLVIARKKISEYQSFNLSETFFNLTKTYPSAFVYAFEKEGVAWIGAFSELLGKYNLTTSSFETMSLAGTLPIEEEWSEKEIKEQKPVTEYILNILSQYSTQVEISDTYDHPSGNIKHLRTDFKTKIKVEQVESIIKDLHPTPAVCGIPKNFCKTAIAEIEKFDRELYAGYSRIELNDSVYYFVNLRCGKFYQDKAELFVGGGITALSDPQNEWRETELKSEALLKNIAFT